MPEYHFVLELYRVMGMIAQVEYSSRRKSSPSVHYSLILVHHRDGAVCTTACLFAVYTTVRMNHHIRLDQQWPHHRPSFQQQLP